MEETNFENVSVPRAEDLPETPVRWTARDQIQLVENLLREAPSVHDVLARPMVYEAWLKKAQEAIDSFSFLKVKNG